MCFVLTVCINLAHKFQYNNKMAENQNFCTRVVCVHAIETEITIKESLKNQILLRSYVLGWRREGDKQQGRKQSLWIFISCPSLSLPSRFPITLSLPSFQYSSIHHFPAWVQPLPNLCQLARGRNSICTLYNTKRIHSDESSSPLLPPCNKGRGRWGGSLFKGSEACKQAPFLFAWRKIRAEGARPSLARVLNTSMRGVPGKPASRQCRNRMSDSDAGYSSWVLFCTSSSSPPTDITVISPVCSFRFGDVFLNCRFIVLNPSFFKSRLW